MQWSIITFIPSILTFRVCMWRTYEEEEGEEDEEGGDEGRGREERGTLHDLTWGLIAEAGEGS